MSNVFDIKDCFGCGLCSTVCNHNVIDIRLNGDGFFQPFINDRSACIDCGLCVKVCSFINDQEESNPVICYAAWSKDKDVLRSSTSGGVSYEVAKNLISQGYTFCGVRYNATLERAEHYLCKELVSLDQSKGSKYLQSYTVNAFLKLNRKEKNVVVGTPCQIASIRRYIELFKCSDNFILIDFFCHGVPSYLMWEKYLVEHSGKLGTLKTVSWRNKLKGWRNSYCVTIDGSEGSLYSWNGKDDFFTMFLGDACLGKACYDSCKFKYNKSAADIRIGDFWGETYKDRQDGVSSVLAFSLKANTILKEANLELEQHPLEVVASGQMTKNPARPWYHTYCNAKLKDKRKPLSTIASRVRFCKNIKGYINRIKRVLNI